MSQIPKNIVKLSMKKQAGGAFHGRNSALRTAARKNAQVIANAKRTYLQSLPRVLLSSALCKCGYWSASFLRAA